MSTIYSIAYLHRKEYQKPQSHIDFALEQILFTTFYGKQVAKKGPLS